MVECKNCVIIYTAVIRETDSCMKLILRQTTERSRFLLQDLNAASPRSAATMATICQIWRPDRGRCFKTYAIVLVLFMDLVLQCVHGMLQTYTTSTCVYGQFTFG